MNPFLSKLLVSVAGAAVMEGAGFVKQKISEKQAADEECSKKLRDMASSMIGKKIKLCNYHITKYWDSNGNLINKIDRQMKDRNWVVKKSNKNHTRLQLMHMPSQTAIWVSVSEVM